MASRTFGRELLGALRAGAEREVHEVEAGHLLDRHVAAAHAVGDVVRDLHGDVDRAGLQLLALRDGVGGLLDDHLGEAGLRRPSSCRCAAAAARRPAGSSRACTGRCRPSWPGTTARPCRSSGSAVAPLLAGDLRVHDAEVAGVHLGEERRVGLRQRDHHGAGVGRVDGLDAADQVRRRALQRRRGAPTTTSRRHW